MASSNTKYADSVKALIQPGTVRHILFMIGIALSVALGIGLYSSIREPLYRPLDYQITEKNMSAIIDTLEKSGIHYKIDDRNGLLMVPASDVELARLKLSAAGVPKDDGFNFSFLNEQNALTNSQFLENARYLRALENDLSKTITGIEGVSGARVHIAIPRNNVFADENNRVTASIVLSISPGFMSNKEKIRAIIQVVADSVPGLDPKDIAITDQYGHFLSEGLDQNSVYSAAQLSYQNNLQGYYEKRIQSMIEPLLGENKVIVRVNADIDFTQQENAQEDYDPNKTALLSEQSNSESTDSSGASGPPGSLSNSPPDSGSKGASGQSATGQRRTQSTKNYNVSKTVTYKRTNTAQVKSLSVAVVVDNEMVLDPKTKKYVSKPLTADKISKITELVKTVIGYDEKRGDKVTVVNSVYSPVKELIPETKIGFWEKPWFWDVIRKTTGIILGFTFLFILYRKLASYAAQMRQAKPKSVFVPEEDDQDENSINRMTNVKKEGITQLKQMAITEPNKVATIIKGWIRK